MIKEHQDEILKVSFPMIGDTFQESIEFIGHAFSDTVNKLSRLGKAGTVIGAEFTVSSEATDDGIKIKVEVRHGANTNTSYMIVNKEVTTVVMKGSDDILIRNEGDNAIIQFWYQVLTTLILPTIIN